MLPDDQRPLWMDPWRLQSLAEQKLLMPMTIVPPGVEGYDHGLFGWKLTPEGEDSIEQHRSEVFEQARQIAEKETENQRVAVDRRKNRIHDVVLLVIGWFLGNITPVDIWDWICDAVVKMWEFLH